MNNVLISRFGLNERDINTLTTIFMRHPCIKEIRIFGSRANGNFKKGSDIDLAIMNKGVSEREVNNIKAELEESSLPYLVDIIDFNTLQHKELKEQIERRGVSFYKK